MMYSVKDKNGKDLDKSLYKIDFEKKTFSSREHYLVIDFSGLDGWFFDTLSYCEFKTGNNCKFYTWSNCVFKTGYNCSFDTLYCCSFETGNNCKLIVNFETYKLDKGFCFIYNNCKLHRDIDENWALLNTKHEHKFIRNLCKEILKG